MKLNLKDLSNSKGWKDLGIEIPLFDVSTIMKNTKDNPKWMHFGVGNIFRGFIASLYQDLVNEDQTLPGIVAVETFDYEVIDKIYRPYDNLALLVLMDNGGNLKKKVIGTIAESLKIGSQFKEQWEELKDIFKMSSLQMISFTITEKGYKVVDLSGNPLKVIKEDIDKGPDLPQHAMSILTALLYERYKVGQLPISLVSMDNYSKNGDKLKKSVLYIAKGWQGKEFVEPEFIEYLENQEKVAFPWTAIDKIVPRPSENIKNKLEKDGLENMDIVVTGKNTFIAPFINAEIPQYLVIEDKFPNGRPQLEKAGVIFTDRKTVSNFERMKVTTCLNPLHTALAVFGCLLGYTSIAEEMRDEDLRKLIENIGYKEGLPVVIDPGVISPKDFIEEVIDVRLSNPFIPDTPQRIATDTSQKVAIRYGETIKAYIESPDKDVNELVYIPLTIAGWCRYLLGVDDNNEPFQQSSDPMLEELKGYLKEVKLGDPDSVEDSLKPILSSKELFGLDLYQCGLSVRIEKMFQELIEGKKAVRETLKKYL